MRHTLCAIALIAGLTSACNAETPQETAEEIAAADAATEVDADSQTQQPEGEESAADHPEARLYDASIDAGQALEAALIRAKLNNTHVLVAMGANWCHDSRAFAGWMETERFKQLIAKEYELIYVNVGRPQSQDGHNLHIAKRFGVEVEGTPTILLLSADGEILNPESAASWRNAASRSEEEIYEELALMATTEIARE